MVKDQNIFRTFSSLQKRYVQETKELFKNRKTEMILSLENISLNFGGIKAVDKVSFDVNEGEIFALIGPNGAGKSTIFNIISRYYNQSTGSIIFKLFFLIN